MVSMNDYTKSITPIEGIRSAKKSELLNYEEKSLFRRFVGRISWLSENTRPDLAYSILKLSQKSQKDPTIGDLKSVNNLVKKVLGRSSEIVLKENH